MPVLVTAGMVKTLRHLFGSALDETYTRVPIVPVVDGVLAPVLDDWGQQLTASGTPVTGGSCKLRTVETVSRDDRGALLIRRPFLWVRHDDPIAVGDLVRDVRDGEGRLLLAAAAVVRVEATPVGPGTVTTAVELEGAEAIPLPAPGEA
jgi:hypothetical protein